MFNKAFERYINLGILFFYIEIYYNYFYYLEIDEITLY